MSVSLKIDWTKCDGRGHCAEILPELLAVDPWGYPISRQGSGPGTKLIAVPAGLEEHADLAVAVCPKLALVKLVTAAR
jgi:ferredoxin